MSRIPPVVVLLAAAVIAAGAPVTAAADPMGGAAPGLASSHASSGATPDLLPAPDQLPTPDGAVDTAAAAIDGALVVGTASDPETGTRAIAWDLAADPPQIIELGTAFGPSHATGVSGTLVVGMAVVEEGGPPVPVAWSLGGDHVRARAIGDAGDTVAGVSGRLAVGSTTDADGTTAVAWNLSDLGRPVRVALDPARRFAESVASAVRGSTVVGTVFDGWTYRAAAWELGGRAPAITVLDTSDADSAAQAIGDRFAAGYRDTGSGSKATMWNLAADRTPLARALAAGSGSTATASDGGLVAGDPGDGGKGSAAVWELTASGPVAHLLTAGDGATSAAAAVSGRTVAGTVTSVGGRTTAAVWTVGLGRVHVDGLLAPLTGNGAVNTVRAGQVVPLRFRLHGAGAGGIEIEDLRARVSSRVVRCPSGAVRVPVEAAVQASTGVQGFGDGLYRVTWAAAAASGACREVVVTIDGPDGVEFDAASMRALFEIVP